MQRETPKLTERKKQVVKYVYSTNHGIGRDKHTVISAVHNFNTDTPYLEEICRIYGGDDMVCFLVKQLNEHKVKRCIVEAFLVDS